MAKKKDRFLKSNGDLTSYAFICGYVQESKTTDVKMFQPCPEIYAYEIEWEDVKCEVGSRGRYKWGTVHGLGRARREFRRKVREMQK